MATLYSYVVKEERVHPDSDTHIKQLVATAPFDTALDTIIRELTERISAMQQAVTMLRIDQRLSATEHDLLPADLSAILAFISAWPHHIAALKTVVHELMIQRLRPRLGGNGDAAVRMGPGKQGTPEDLHREINARCSGDTLVGTGATGHRADGTVRTHRISDTTRQMVTHDPLDKAVIMIIYEIRDCLRFMANIRGSIHAIKRYGTVDLAPLPPDLRVLLDEMDTLSPHIDALSEITSALLVLTFLPRFQNNREE